MNTRFIRRMALTLAALSLAMVAPAQSEQPKPANAKLADVKLGEAKPATAKLTNDCSLGHLAAMKEVCELKQYHSIPNFKLGGKYNLDDPKSYEFGGEGGVTLESLGMPPLRTAYITLGTPKTNAKGGIINAIVINSYYSGDAANMYTYWVKGGALGAVSVIGPGKLFDTDKYYVVLVDALGLWGASKPSDGLGMKFPKYSTLDMVQANYRLLRDKLNVAEVALATGCSLGGSQTWVWGVLHSADGFVKAILPIGGSTATDGEGDPLARWIFTLMTSAIKSDPAWYKTKGDYYQLPKEQHPTMGLAFGWSVLNHTGFDFAFRATQPFAAVEPLIFSWEPKGKEASGVIATARVQDANDFLYRNMAGDEYNINKELGRIKARALVIHVENDQWLMASKARAAAAQVKGSGFLTFRDNVAHYAVFKAPDLLKDKIAPFLANEWVASGPGAEAAVAAADAPPPAAKPAGLTK